MISILIRQFVFVFIIALISVIYFNCDDSSVNTTQNSQFCVSAQLSGWVPGNKTLYMNIYSNTKEIYPVANCSVDDQGNFKICFPDSFSDSTLWRADSIFFSGCHGGTASFNPPDARGVEEYNFRVKKNDTVCGAIDYKTFTNSDSIKVGDFEVFYVYANQTVSGSGYELCGSDTLYFNGTAKSGWNKIVKHYTRVTTLNRTILYDLNEPPGAVWRYHGN